MELEWNARRRIDCLFHGVAGNVALNELVLSSLANLEHEEPLAVDLANHCLLAEENGASARLLITMKDKRNEGTTKASIDHTNAEGVHHHGLHHFAVQQNKGNRFVV